MRWEYDGECYVLWSGLKVVGRVVQVEHDRWESSVAGEPSLHFGSVTRALRHVEHALAREARR